MDHERTARGGGPAGGAPPGATRREWIRGMAAGAAALAAAGTLTGTGARPAAAAQKRFRASFGLNGFQSSSAKYKKTFPIWEVLDFAQREGFEGIEILPGWPSGDYPSADDTRAVEALKGLYARYDLKIFSMQTFCAEAFQVDAAVRAGWLERFAGWALLAERLGCECLGTWPGGGLGGQTLDHARDLLIDTLRKAAAIAADHGLTLSMELEPPFVFHTLEDMVKVVDGVGHPAFRTMCDISHFDLMNGGKGKPEELLEKVGVQRIGYIHFTDCDGTLRDGGTSKHLPAGDGHCDLRKLLEVLWRGGFSGWVNIDPWEIPDPYDACRKGKRGIDAAQAEFKRTIG
jgi:sugar phosphate isomerase/epimerase